MRVVTAKRRRRMIPPIRFLAAPRAIRPLLSSRRRRRTPPRHRAATAGSAVPDAAGPAPPDLRHRSSGDPDGR
ncbi:hypothetical protein Airi01_082000 [Actinoallomurus iriomotensis]|uniref:Uncharacterized protein n=1 Tax=Actinoallomurus iriomotensis TaxID=478107 RepID=A0A9W6RQJ4_9ACTN|nr:hypothetical protein Airi01_082000 [Actinoallomurus iriomotensis]